MSGTPDSSGRLPGQKRVERMATPIRSSGGKAYEGAFEAVGAILIATGLGYWFDQHYETTPIGILVGAAIGFAAFVLRLIRLGKQLHPETEAGSASSPPAAETAEGEHEIENAGPAVGLGLSDVFDHDDERKD